MSTQEVASRLVEMCRQGQNMEALSELYAEHCVSREMPGMPNVLTEGLTAIKAKSENWYATVEEFHGGEVCDPVVAGNYFCLLYTSPSPRDQRGSRMPSSA